MCCLREVIFQYYYNTWFCLENKTYLLFLIIQLVKKKGFQKFLGYIATWKIDLIANGRKGTESPCQQTGMWNVCTY